MDVALNWIWQGALVAVATALLLRLVPATSPEARYRIVWTALLSLYLLPIVAIALALAALAPDTAADAPGPALVSLPAIWWTSDAAALAVWGMWVVVTLAQAARSIARLRRAAQSSVPLPIADQAQLPHWTAVQTTGRRARLGMSDAVPSAAVLAGTPPLIAIAPALLALLTDEELDRVVIHEWAHVQRRDDLSVFAQLFVRITLGWHPAAWWLSRQLHAEREAACDQLAVSITGSPKAYAGCLAKVATLRARTLQPLPAVGVLARTGLRDRVVRILSPRRRLSSWHRAGLAAASIVPCTVALPLGGVMMIEAARAVAEVTQIDGFALRVAQDRALEPADAAPASISAAPPRELVARQPRFGAGSQDPVTPEPVAQSPAASQEAHTVVAVEEPPLPVVPSTLTVPLDSPLRAPVPAQSTAASAGVSATRTQHPPTTIWGAAADGGTAVGRSSQKAAVATAGFFTRVSKKIAGSF